MKRYLYPALLVPVLAAAPVQAQETEAERTDRGMIVGFLEDNLSGAGRQVVLRGFQGALSSRATATQLTIADDQGIWLTLNDIVLDWNRSALLGGRVEVTELSAAEIIVERAPVAADGVEVPAPEAGGFALPELPVSVRIDKVAAPRVVLGETLLGQPIEGAIEAQLSLSGGEGGARLQIERSDDGPDGRIDLTAGFNNTTQVLDISLDAREAAGGIAATLLNLPGAPSVDLTVKGTGPLDAFRADIALASDGAQRLGGQIALTGTGLGETGFSADLRGDLAPLFIPEYADFLGDELALVVRGARTADSRTELSRLELSARSLELQGSARIAADGLPEFLDLTGSLRDPDGRPVVLPGSDAGVSLRAARLAVVFDAAKGEDWTATVAAEGVSAPQGSATLLDLNGKGRIARGAAGRVVDGTLAARASGLAPVDPALAQALGDAATMDAGFSWQESTGGLRIDGLRLLAGPVEAGGAAQISGLDDGFRIAGNLRVDARDLAPLSALSGRPLAGAAVIVAEGEGSPLGGDFDLRAQIDGRDLSLGIAEVDGLLRGASSIALDALRDGTGTHLRALRLRAPGLTVDGKGQVSSQDAVLDLTLAMDDLGRLGPAYGGRVAGRLDLSGPLTEGRARIEADLNTTDLRIGQAEADRMLAGAARLTLLADLQGEALEVERLAVTAPSGTIDLTGRLAEAGSDVTARLSLADLSRLRPGFGGRLEAEATVTGTAEDAVLTLGATGAGLRVGQAQADRLLAGATELSGRLRLEGGAIRLDDLKLSNPQLSVDATGRIAEGRRDVDLNARLVNLGLILPEFPGPVTLTGTAIDTGNGYDLALSGTGPGQIDARVAGRVAPDFASGDVTLRGSAQAGLANPFLGSRVVSGPLSLDLRLNGPFALSSVSGRVGLSQGRLVDPSLPFALEGIDLAATLGGGRVQLSGSTQVSSGGRITIAGPIGLDAPYAADLAIGLQSVVVRDPQLYQTRANGDLRISGPLTGGAAITGRIALPETEIRVAATGLSGQALIDGLRHVGDSAAVRETRRRAGIDGTAGAGAAQDSGGPAYGLDLTISAPNQLFIRGRGLDAELGGTLRITGTTANVIPSGGFQLIRGRLDILGRRLTLSEASLFLEGDFNPEMRIIASSENDGITSSVVIEGNASEPEVTFTSQPELPQEEVLAHLLFGRRLDNLSAMQALQLASAVATLAGRGGEGIVSRLRQGFGLDDLDVQTDAEGNAQLTAGKYLTENIYSEVQVDQTGKTQINLNLDLTDTLTVRGKVSADGNTGIGLFYEKDY